MSYEYDTTGALIFALAIFSALFGSFFSSLALVFMKWAHLRLNKQDDKPRSILLSPFWWGGFLMLGIGNFCNIKALDWGNQLLMSTTCCFSVIFNTIFCVLLLKEKLYFIRLVAVIVICIGSSIFLSLGKNSEEDMTFD